MFQAILVTNAYSNPLSFGVLYLVPLREPVVQEVISSLTNVLLPSREVKHVRVRLEMQNFVTVHVLLTK